MNDMQIPPQAAELRRQIKDTANLIASQSMHLPAITRFPIIEGLIDGIIACAVLEAYAKLAKELQLPNPPQK